MSNPLNKDNTRVEKDLIQDNYSLSPGNVDNGKSEIAYSYSFAGGCLEPTYSKIYNVNCIVNGKPVKKKILRASYTIPIHSGLVGCLMP